MLDELEEIKKMVAMAINEVEKDERQYKSLETKSENAVMLLYLIDIAKPILRCKDKATRLFNRQTIEKQIEQLIAKHMGKAYYAFNMADILKREAAFEHLKYALSTGHLLKKSKIPPNLT